MPTIYRSSPQLNQPRVESTEGRKEKFDISINLIGKSGVGKSTWIRRLSQGEFQRNHEPNVGTNWVYTCETFDKEITFHIHEYKLDSDITFSDFNIFMFDSDTPETREYIEASARDTRNIFVFTKSDCTPETNQICVEFDQICKNRLFRISSKTNYDFQKPLLQIARRFFRHPRLQFVPIMAEAPPVWSNY